MVGQATAALTGGRGSEGRVSGYVFKMIRESAGQTQEQLAEHLQMGLATIQGWESGRRSLLAIPAGNFLTLRTRLRLLGADAHLLDSLALGLEADLLIGQILATPHLQADPKDHPLSSLVATRSHTEMTAWPLSMETPKALAGAICRTSRRGPTPSGPSLSDSEYRHVISHLQAVAERADRRTLDGRLLIRQAYYLIGFDSSPGTRAWLAQMYRTDQRQVRTAKGWSPTWPLARSTASALARLGDPEPMRRFIADQLSDDAGERANLNYWAFWTGDLHEQQTSDAFIGLTPLAAWHGQRLLRHLLDRLHGDAGFLELNIHTLWSLARIRPELISDAVADELTARIEHLLDEESVSTAARRELEALRYGTAMIRRS